MDVFEPTEGMKKTPLLPLGHRFLAAASENKMNIYSIFANYTAKTRVPQQRAKLSKPLSQMIRMLSDGLPQLGFLFFPPLIDDTIGDFGTTFLSKLIYFKKISIDF